MAENQIINKVIDYSNTYSQTLLDLTQDTVNRSNLEKGQTAHDREGEKITGQLLLEDAEAWARGTRNGEPVTSEDETYHNNSKWYSTVSGSIMQITGQMAQAAATSATNADYSKKLAQSYAKGNSGLPDRPGEETDNAEYFMTQANDNALKSEGFAVGKQNGTDVGSTSPYYHNNAEYYKNLAEEAAAQAGALDMTGATATTDGTHGLIKQPHAGDQDKVFYGNGTWKYAGDVRRSELVDTVGWTGKNLIPYPYSDGASKTRNGINYTDVNGVITANGTCDSSKDSYFGLWITTSLPQGEYILSGCPAGGSATTYSLRIEHNTQRIASDTGNGAKLIINEANYQISIMIYVYKGTSISNLVFRPMLRHADVIDDTYEPYHESVEETLKDYEVLHSDNLLDYFDYISVNDAVITRDGDDITVTSGSGTYKRYEPLNPETGDVAFPAGSYQIYINIKSTNSRARLATRNASTNITIQNFDISSTGVKRFDITPSVPFYIAIFPKVDTSESGLSVTFNNLMLSKTPIDKYKPYSIPLKDRVNALDADKAETTEIAKCIDYEMTTPSLSAGSVNITLYNPAITAEMKARPYADYSASGAYADLTVNTYDGSVTLTGTVSAATTITFRLYTPTVISNIPQ